MKQGIFVIQKTTGAVIAIAEDRFNPENHTKLEGEHGKPWAIETPPPVPAVDIVKPSEGRQDAEDAASTEEAAPEEPSEEESPTEDEAEAQEVPEKKKRGRKKKSK